MSKRQKYEEAIRALEDAYIQDIYHLNDTKFLVRRRKQLCDAIVALGGDNPDDPGGGGGGPGNDP